MKTKKQKWLPLANAHVLRLIMLIAMIIIPIHLVKAAPVTISSITGWNAGDLVINGRWTGQPTFSRPPLSNAYKDMLAIESQSSNATFTINGKNFGTQKGSVHFLDSSLSRVSNVVVTIKSWSDTKIVVAAKCSYSFTYSKNVYVRVSRDINPPPQSYEGAAMFWLKGFVGVIKTRGYGQCTWYVANRRLYASKTIPTTAYSTTGTISASYVPQKWDGLTYGTKHVAIITSTPTKTTASDGTVTYTFTVSEMNAITDEKMTSDTRRFALKAGKIVTSIGSRAGSTYIATGYWR